jgi:hypothetical protein
MVSLCGMIVNDIQNNFNAFPMEPFDHSFEFFNLLPKYSGT